jgi:hypothetical protein
MNYRKANKKAFVKNELNVGNKANLKLKQAKQKQNTTKLILA